MATVVKMNYTSPGQGVAKAKAGSASLKYFTQRPDWEGKNPDREVITREGRFKLQQDGEWARREIEYHLDQSRGEHLYRLVMSSGDQQLSARETEQWARDVLERNGHHNYLMVVHAGDQRHTNHPHVHVLVSTAVKFDAEQITELRRTGDERLSAMRQVEQPVPLHREIEAEAKGPAKKGGGKEAEREDEQRPQKKKHLDFQLD